MALLEVKHLKKTYTTRFGGTKVEALKDVEFSVEKGEYVAIMGESGSGKTTLLNILAALDRPTGGKVLLDGKDMAAVPDSRMESSDSTSWSGSAASSSTGAATAGTPALVVPSSSTTSS